MPGYSSEDEDFEPMKILQDPKKMMFNLVIVAGILGLGYCVLKKK
tara:strand:+ start:316 stop:450 length:135 start_codon:yes stop_codon:yes gene_type:complete